MASGDGFDLLCFALVAIIRGIEMLIVELR